ncbi:MAG: hypothetical protein QE487_12170 [Fluviicola sp.]|nr:hypothetical protein [Fluviicola sp.]
MSNCIVAHDWFRDRQLIIATNHGKEQVISPLLASRLGVRCSVAESLNTDRFGTFSGEIERLTDPLTAARNKCEAAMDSDKVDLAIASEGSFGSHPTLFFVPANEELLLLTDRKNNVEFSVSELFTETNFASEWVKSAEELMNFAEKALFPSHGLILRTSDTNAEHLVKGIVSQEELLHQFNLLQTHRSDILVQTDMRAHLNPTRMNNIRKVTEKLVERLNTECKECGAPGFGVVRSLPGLPCEWCRFPTPSTLYHEYGCVVCEHTEKQYYPYTKQVESATYCNYCNP